MNHFIFNQLEFVRGNTLKDVEDLTEQKADTIHDGFRNNIRWNLGHIYVVQERFAFQSNELPMKLPEAFIECFSSGTSPSDWKARPPAIEEIITLLREQPQRIRLALEERLHEKVKKPYTTSSGLTLETAGEFLTFNLYHEGKHISTIKSFKELFNK